MVESFDGGNVGDGRGGGVVVKDTVLVLEVVKREMMA